MRPVSSTTSPTPCPDLVHAPRPAASPVPVTVSPSARRDAADRVAEAARGSLHGVAEPSRSVLSTVSPSPPEACSTVLPRSGAAGACVRVPRRRRLLRRVPTRARGRLTRRRPHVAHRRCSDRARWLDRSRAPDAPDCGRAECRARRAAGGAPIAERCALRASRSRPARGAVARSAWFLIDNPLEPVVRSARTGPALERHQRAADGKQQQEAADQDVRSFPSPAM